MRQVMGSHLFTVQEKPVRDLSHLVGLRMNLAFLDAV
jgi:hypothetical protein